MPRPLAFLGVPFDGGATLGWPGARYAPDEVRRNLAWMRMRVEEGRIYWIDRDEVVPFDPDSLLFPSVAGLHDALSGVVAVVHFDAHLDLTEGNPRQGTHSQSSGMRRALELDRVDAHQCVQVGTRNFNFPSSKAFIDSVGITEIPATRVLADGVPAAMATVDSVIGAADHLFVSVDVDVLDPAFAPGVGWQEPGGLTVRQLLDFLVALAPRADGLALNEVNPMTDHRSQTSIVAANLIFQFAVAAGLGNR